MSSLFASRFRLGRPFAGRAVLAAVSVLALLAPTAIAEVTPSGLKDPRVWEPRPLQAQQSVPGQPAGAPVVPAQQSDGAPSWQAPTVSWPQPAEAEVELAAVPQAQAANARSPFAAEPGQPQPAGRAGATPAWIRPAAAAPQAGSGVAADAQGARPVPSGKVAVTLADRTKTGQVGVQGLMVTLAPRDAAARGRIVVGVDYAGIQGAFGGDWASRTRLVALPGCVLTTPDKPECRTQTPVPGARNDVVAKQVYAEVDLAADGDQPMVLAAAAAPSGPNGDYTATPLNPTGSWSAGGNTGTFSWTYPVAAPPALGGTAPNVTLSYNSASVDGRTSTRNAQSSWLGDGWEYHPGYIERGFASCKADGKDNTGDACWSTKQPLTMSLNGASTALVPVDGSPNTWRSEDGSLTRIERLTGGNNGDAGGAGDTGEYWKITTTDGTQYFFGEQQSQAPGAVASNATWTRPVFANNTGEPCYNADFAAAWCQQAWRWNLTSVIDVRGNLVSYTYTKETNTYARNPDQAHPDGTLTDYTHGGQLARVDYGYKANGTQGPTARILFNTEERCAPGKTCPDGGITKENQADWPDVPYDQFCDATKPVTDCKNYAPTFWTTRRLKSITTQVLTGGNPVKVDEYAFAYDFPTPSDGSSPALWLKSITRTAYAGDGNEANKTTLPSVDFNGTFKPNRVNYQSGTNLTPLNRRRLTDITTETGARITVTYASDCTADALPQPASNTKRCYPVYWNPSPGTPMDPTLDWFHKYVVTGVSETDTSTANSPIRTTRYQYVGGAAWHRDDSELTEEKYRTYNDFRGYSEVITRKGNTAAYPGDLTLKTSTVYLRGMYGDWLTADGTSVRQDTIPDSGGAHDINAFAGFVRETRTFDGDTDTVATRTTNDPVIDDPNNRKLPAPLVHDRGDKLPDQVAQMVRTEKTTTKSLLSNGQYRSTAKSTVYDKDYGVAKTVLDSADGLPDYCATTNYAHNPALNLLALPIESYTVTGNCSVAPGTATTVTHTRTLYDNLPYGQVGAIGAPTTAQVVDGYNGSTPSHTLNTVTAYDQYGRTVKSTDPAQNSTTAAYVPDSGALPSQVKVTGPMGADWTTTTDYNTPRNLPIKTTDINGRVTEMTYDPAGRLTAVWKPGRDRSAGKSASMLFEYNLSKTTPSVVTTKTALDAGGYTVSQKIYDAFLQVRQTQANTADTSPGRLLTDTFYDSLGRPQKVNKTYWDKTTYPNGALWQADDNMVPGQTATYYDGQGRKTKETFSSYAIDQSGTPSGGTRMQQWSTLTTYPGAERTSVTPPDGGTATTVITDARGKTAELRQYRDRTKVGQDDLALFDKTVYTYDGRGQLASVTGPTHPIDRPTGDTWTWRYDLLGRQVHTEDPDKGPADTVYDELGRVASTTDARGQTLAYTYDKISRKTGLYNGTITPANLLASWSYDQLAKGQADGSTRYVGGQTGAAYTTRTTGLDVAYRPTGTSVTIPSTEGKLAGTYTTGQSYTNGIGLPLTTTLPAAGDLPAETLTTIYGDTDLPVGLTNGSFDYINATTYDPFGRVKRLNLGDVPKQVAYTPIYDDATGRLMTTTLDRQTDQDGNPVGASVDITSYTYAPNGNVTSITTRRDDGAVDRQCFTYDYLQRMTQAWTDKNTGAGGLDVKLPPSVPGIGKCANTTPSSANIGGPSPYWQTYLFDPTGNRTQLVDHDPTGATGKDATTTYTSPAEGQPQPHTVDKAATTTGGTTTEQLYDYDAAGNTTYRPGTPIPGNPGTVPALPANQFMEAEDSAKVTVTSNSPTGTATCCGTTWSGGKQVWTGADGEGDWVTYQINVPVAGTYTFRTVQTVAPDFGKLQANLDGSGGTGGKDVGWSFDAYRSTVGTTTVNWAKVSLTAGPHKFTLRVTGKNTNSSGYAIGVDTITLVPDWTVEAENLPATGTDAIGPADCCGTTWSANRFLHFAGNADGDNFSVKVNVPANGEYQIKAVQTKAKEFGQTHLTVDGASIGGFPFDAYQATGVSTAPVNYGRVRLTAGEHTLTFTVRTSPFQLADPNVTTLRYWAGIDTITLTPTAGPDGTATRGGDQTLTWDPEGRLAKVETTETGIKKTSEYLYDADGNRLLRVDPGQVTLYLGTTELTLAGARGNTTAPVTGTRYYSTPGGGPTIVRTGTKLAYQAGDHHGTAGVSLTQDLALTRRDTKPYGDPRGTLQGPGPWPDDKGFLGKPQDTTGLTHIGAREYDPGLGRFISVDPVMDLADPQQMHGYAYANSRPATSSDPTGLLVPDDGSTNRDVDLQNGDHTCGVECITQPVITGGGDGKCDCTGSATDPQMSLGRVLTDDEYQGLKQAGYKGTQLFTFQEAEEYVTAGVFQYAYACMAVFYLGAPHECQQAAYDYFDPPENPFKKYLDCFSGDAKACVSAAVEAVILIATMRGPKGAPIAGEAGAAERTNGIFGVAAGCLSHSFTPDTMVLMADGTFKKIGEISAGDVVLATDPATGKNSPQTVERLITTLDDKDFVKISVNGEAQTLIATATHPFWLPEQRQWVDAGNLNSGDWLQTSAGSWVRVSAVERIHKLQQTNDLTVSNDHTYYVLAGKTPVLVHNSTAPCEPARIALGLSNHGLQARAAGTGAMDLMQPGLDWEWFIRQGIVEARGPNPSVVFEVHLDGLRADRLGLPAGASVESRVSTMADIGAGGGGGPFAWELAQLRDAGLLGSVRFYEDMNVVANPFAR